MVTFWQASRANDGTEFLFISQARPSVRPSGLPQTRLLVLLLARLLAAPGKRLAERKVGRNLSFFGPALDYRAEQNLDDELQEFSHTVAMRPERLHKMIVVA